MTINTRPRICVKALRSRGGIIEWNYETPQQVARFWRELVNTGRTPDTGENLESAVYFDGGREKKRWDREAQKREAARAVLDYNCRLLGI